MSNGIEELKPVEGISAKPFYFKSPKMNIRAYIVSGIILLIFSIIYPYLFIAVPFYLYYLYKKIKYYKSEPSILLHEGIEKYLMDKFDESLYLLNRLADLEPDNIKCNIIKALIYYKQEYYEKSITMLEMIPEKVLNNDLDLMLKLADSYLKNNEKNKAKELYTKILKIYPNSKYIKGVLEEL